MPEYTKELRAEVDAAMAKADKHGWAVDEDGDLVLRVPTCWKEDAWQDKAGRDNAAAIVALHNAYSALTAHIDAQAKRIAELEAENARLRECVAKAADQFGFYATEHRAKVTPAAHIKAETNEQMRDMMLAALKDTAQ